LGLDPEVKWPNDVLLGGKKVCGILAEATWLGGELQALVVGIGVNIAPSSVPPPEEVMFPATCVEDHLGHHTERFDLLRACVAALLARRHQSRQEILSDWDKRLAFKGETVRVVPPGENALVGTLMGIDTQGFLRLKSGPGAERLISAGDLTLRLE
jgi:BirA family biotin operon repressor/biotin-[acetyl-CoA-carboxylase] ligase